MGAKGTKERILEAAVEAARRDGHRGASVEEIAGAAGITRQALYRHFPTKDDLFRASVAMMQERSLAAGSAKAQAARKTGAAAPDVLFTFLHARYDMMMSVAEGTHAAELLEEHSRLCADVTAKYMALLEAALIREVETEQRAGRLKLRAGLTPAALAQALLVCARGVKAGGAAMSRRAFRTGLKRMVDLVIEGAAKRAPGV